MNSFIGLIVHIWYFIVIHVRTVGNFITDIIRHVGDSEEYKHGHVYTKRITVWSFNRFIRVYLHKQRKRNKLASKIESLGKKRKKIFPDFSSEIYCKSRDKRRWLYSYYRHNSKLLNAMSRLDTELREMDNIWDERFKTDRAKMIRNSTYGFEHTPIHPGYTPWAFTVDTKPKTTYFEISKPNT